MSPYSRFSSLASLAETTQKRSVFISYHHVNDQYYYNEFSKFISSDFIPIQDNSIERKIDSTNVDYVIQRIKDNHIKGTSCTFVLCGPETFNRKYVDWEIKGTLEKDHALIGIILPNCIKNFNGKYSIPDRLFDNVETGYASMLFWNQLFPTRSTLASLALQPINLKEQIDLAISRSKSLIINTRERMSQNINSK